jgi:hypothetical protein
LQTRVGVQSILQERLGTTTLPSPGGVAGAGANPLDQSMQAVQQQLNALKDKVNNQNKKRGQNPRVQVIKNLLIKRKLKNKMRTLLLREHKNDKMLPIGVTIGPEIVIRVPKVHMILAHNLKQVTINILKATREE